MCTTVQKPTTVCCGISQKTTEDRAEQRGYDVLTQGMQSNFCAKRKRLHAWQVAIYARVISYRSLLLVSFLILSIPSPFPSLLFCFPRAERPAVLLLQFAYSRDDFKETQIPSAATILPLVTIFSYFAFARLAGPHLLVLL